jgi:hypothetical protein
MSNPNDYWDAEDFEDTVAAALIGCFETNIRASQQKKIPKQWRITKADLELFRKVGPYIPANNRVVMTASDEWPAALDMTNDGIPSGGCIAIRRPKDYRPGAAAVTGYIVMLHFREEKSLPIGWKRTSGGRLFSLRLLAPDTHGIYGDIKYFNVDAAGNVAACDFNGFPMPGKTLYQADIKLAANITQWAFNVMSWQNDRRFCWTISAQESTARAHLGCMQEEVKSLLYARSLPMTSTGRKRPILHLVEAHKRRMKNGTDVDVTAFLRGQQSVEIGGTLFSVNPPPTLRPEVSKPSQERYFKTA